MSRMMDREGYFRPEIYKKPKWGKTLAKIYKAMESFCIDVYLEGGTLPEAMTHLTFEAHRAVGNARVHFLARDGAYQKKLRRKRKLAARRST